MNVLRRASAIMGVLALAPGASAQASGSPASLDGVWEVRVSSTLFGDDGETEQSKVTVVVEFDDDGEGGNLEIRSFPLAFDTVLFPETSGAVFSDYFFAKNTDEEQIATIAGTIRTDSSGEGKSFRATATLAHGDGVLVAQLRGRRITSNVPGASLLVADFESGLTPYTETNPAGFPNSTLWHAEAFCASGTPIPSSMGAMAAAYNRGDEMPPVYNFNTGDTNAGALQSPSVAVPSGTRGIQIVFDMLRDGESGTTFDQSFVQVRAVGAETWTSLGQLLDQRDCGSSPQTISVGLGKKSVKSILGQTFSHRFLFDSVDSVANNAIGWYVDNVVVRVFQ